MWFNSSHAITVGRFVPSIQPLRSIVTDGLSTDASELLVIDYQSASFTSMVVPGPAAPVLGAVDVFAGRRRRR